VANLAVEVFDSELPAFQASGLSYELVRGQNFDGIDVNTILISLTSAASIRAVCQMIVEILEQRKSGKIKVNGMELTNGQLCP
jgi:hypothetical protein